MANPPLQQVTNLTLLHAVYTLLVCGVVWRVLPTTLRKWTVGFLVAGFVWSVLSVLAWHRGEVEGIKDFWGWFFNSSAEGNSAAIITSTILLMIAVSALIIVWRASATWWQRGYWLLVCALFAFLSLDEFYSIHEDISWWRDGYLLLGGGVAFFGLLVAIRNLRWRRWVLLFLFGLFLMGFAGVALDSFSNENFFYIGESYFTCDYRIGVLNIDCQRYGITEELLELHGATIMLMSLAALISQALSTSPQASWRRAKRLIGAFGVLWLVWLVGGQWLFPSIEARVQTPVQATYLDGKLSLVSYTTSRDTLVAGEPLDVTLYMRANDFLGDDYSLSLQLFSQPMPNVESVAAFDMTLSEEKYLSSAWLPGLVTRNRFRLPVPDDLATPASYRLVAILWLADAANRQVVEQTDLGLFDESTLILDTHPAYSQTEIDRLSIFGGYTFNEAFTLASYDLPQSAEVGGALPLQFEWIVTQDVNQSLTQFVHLFHEETDAFINLDQQTFAGMLPTTDWQAGMHEIDQWTPTLPDDMPAGTYRVQMGLFETATVTRLPILDAEGNPIVDSSIVLGNLTITEP